MAYVVIVGYVTVETAVPGGRAEVDVPRGAMLPDDVPAERVRTLLAAGDIGPAEADPAADEAHTPVPAGTIADIRAWVGSDPARAARALAAETAGANRSTLVAELTKLAAAE